MKDKNIDIRLFGVLIPVINVFNYYLTYTKISFGLRTLITFSLDRKLPFAPQPLRRVAVQLFTTITAGMLVIIGLTELTNTIAGTKPVPVSFYTHDILIISVWFIVLNGIYLGLHLYQEWQQAEAPQKGRGASPLGPLHRRIVTGFEKAENGRLNVLLKPAAQIPSPVSVSRTKAAAFKKWFTPDQAGLPE